MSTDALLRAQTGTPPATFRLTGLLALVLGLLIFVPMVVLGSAINWPDSLSAPASTMLPMLHDNESAVRIGYTAYLGYSILFGIVMIMLAKVAGDHLSPTARRMVVGFAIASVVARCLGIVRWLAPMPVLADAYTGASGGTPTDATRATISTVYDALNSWGGFIGEVLGVGLFAALSVAALASGLLRSPIVPRVIAYGAVAAAVALAAGAVELFEIDPGPLLTVTVGLLQIWLMAVGIWLLTRRTPR